MDDALTLALWQCEPLPLDVTANLRRLDKAAAQAAQLGADLLVCAEMFLTGYAIGADQVAALACLPDSPHLRTAAEIARTHQVALLFGYPERGADGALYNAALWINAQGERVWNYRKTHLYGGLDRRQFSAGAIANPQAATQALPILKGWQVGVLICYDVEFPENTRRLAAAGADVIVVPTANMRDYDFVPTTLVPVRAFENQCFVAYANYTGADAEFQYGGLSCVAAPDGAQCGQLARLPEMLVVTLHASHLRTARQQQTHLQDHLRLA